MSRTGYSEAWDLLARASADRGYAPPPDVRAFVQRLKLAEASLQIPKSPTDPQLTALVGLIVEFFPAIFFLDPDTLRLLCSLDVQQAFGFGSSSVADDWLAIMRKEISVRG